MSIERLRDALLPLAKIADAYDSNNLDDEARRFWGKNDENENTTPPENIEIFSGRGGQELLTLAQCFEAREALKELTESNFARLLECARPRVYRIEFACDFEAPPEERWKAVAFGNIGTTTTAHAPSGEGALAEVVAGLLK